MKIEGLTNLTPQSYATEAKVNRVVDELARPGGTDSVNVSETDEGSSEYSASGAKRKDSAESLSAAVEDMNAQLSSRDLSIRFRIDQDSKEVVVSVVDQDTNEVVREIPPEEIVRMRANFKKMVGVLMEKTA